MPSAAFACLGAFCGVAAFAGFDFCDDAAFDGLGTFCNAAAFAVISIVLVDAAFSMRNFPYMLGTA